MRQLILMLLLMLSATAFAQDVIVKKDGSTIKAKVLSITNTEVSYKLYNNQKGKTYKIKKTELDSIKYKNGKKVDFSKEEKTETEVKPSKATLSSAEKTKGQTSQPVAQQQPLSDEEILRLYESEKKQKKEKIEKEEKEEKPEEDVRYRLDLPESVFVDKNGKALDESDIRKLNTAYHILTRKFIDLTLYEQSVVAKALGIKRAKKQSEQILRIAGINYKNYIIK